MVCQQISTRRDTAGLGDWQENVKKLPNGIGYLVKEAKDKGIKFGIWVEPEMVNPKSELYEKHPDWVIKQPRREEHYFRNQLVLDLTNPESAGFCIWCNRQICLHKTRIWLISNGIAMQ